MKLTISKVVLVTLLTMALATLGVLPLSASEQYQIIDLGTLGGPESEVFFINNRGQIVGSSWLEGFHEKHAFLWQMGIMTDLGTMGGVESTPFDINERGQIVGSSVTAPGGRHAFLWQDGVMTDLDTLGGSDSIAYSINEHGQIVGVVGFRTLEGNLEIYAFLWQRGVMTDLGTLGKDSYAFSINDRGQIVGVSLTASGESHAVLWTKRHSHWDDED